MALAYGYNLGTQKDSPHFADEHRPEAPKHLEDRLAFANGFHLPEPDWRKAKAGQMLDYHRTRSLVIAKTGIAIDVHHDNPVWWDANAVLLIVTDSATTDLLDVRDLTRRHIPRDWHTRLDGALSTLGIKPRTRPGWIHYRRYDELHDTVHPSK